MNYISSRKVQSSGGKDVKSRLAIRLRFWFLQNNVKNGTKAALLQVAGTARNQLENMKRLRQHQGVGIVDGVKNAGLQLAKRQITPEAAAAKKHYQGYATAYDATWDAFVAWGQVPPYMIVWNGFSELNLPDKVATIFHEMTHLFMGTTDYLSGVYRTIGWDNRTKTFSIWDSSKVATKDALNHADTWTGFVVYTGVPGK